MNTVQSMLAAGKGNGRKRMLAVIDRLLDSPAADTLMYDAMEEQLKLDPVAFYERFVMTQLPKESLVEHVGNADMAGIHIIMDNGDTDKDTVK